MSVSAKVSGGIAPPELDLTPEEMLRRARALRVNLRERQVRCEELGQQKPRKNS